MAVVTSEEYVEQKTYSSSTFPLETELTAGNGVLTTLIKIVN